MIVTDSNGIALTNFRDHSTYLMKNVRMCCVLCDRHTLYCKAKARVSKEKRKKKKSLRTTAGMQFRKTSGFFQLLARFSKYTYSLFYKFRLNAVSS